MIHLYYFTSHDRPIHISFDYFKTTHFPSKEESVSNCAYWFVIKLFNTFTLNNQEICTIREKKPPAVISMIPIKSFSIKLSCN